ncbi:PPOX class F420-dependent oxidoreductase [soil metagenome]
MRDMNDTERREFLLSTARTASLATVRRDGRPHVAPIWFDLDGDTVVFTTGDNTVKARNIRHDARVSLCVDDEEPPFAFVLVEGVAELLDNAPDLRYWATRIGGRYMGEELADSYGARNSVEGELLVRVWTANVVAQRNIAD